MSKISQVKKRIKELDDRYYQERSTLNDELRILIAERQINCTHPPSKIKIRSDSYFEEGRMSGPSYFKEKYCSVCGKALANTYTTEKWSDEK